LSFAFPSELFQGLTEHKNIYELHVTKLQTSGFITSELFFAQNSFAGLREKDPLLYRRAKHVVTENKRTEQAAEALQEGDLKKFGELMTASHESLKLVLNGAYSRNVN
jgi:galactokinase